MFKLIPALNANRKHYQTITVDDLISKIRTNSQHVIDARAAGKYINRSAYDLIKTSKIEAYYPNSYDGNPTGFIYLDIDGFKSPGETLKFKENLINEYKNLIYACWISLSEHGLSILVRSKTVNRYNYYQYWNIFNSIFNNQLDKQSRGYDKVNCISFDPEIYVNNESLNIEEITRFTGSLFKAEDNTEPVNQQDKGRISKSSYNTRPMNQGHNEGYNTEPVNLRYRTSFSDDQFQNINTPLIFPEGVRVLEINSRYFQTKGKIPVGMRTKIIGALSMQLIVLNPLPAGYSEKKLRQQLLNGLLYMNQQYTVEPLSNNEVIKIFNSNYKKYKEQGLDVSKYEIVKYIIWHRECQLSQREKASIGNKMLLLAKGKGTDHNQQRINDAIETLQDGINSITLGRIAEHTGISLSTVKRCYKPFKSIVDEYNKSIKEQPVEVVNDITSLPAVVDTTSTTNEETPQEQKVIINDNGFDITKLSTVFENYPFKNGDD